MRIFQLAGFLGLGLVIGVSSMLSAQTGGAIKTDPGEKKKDDKDDKSKTPSFTYPTQLDGKTPDEWAKIARDSPDASMREMAIRILPSFGPAGRKAGSAALLHALTLDRDAGNRLVALGVLPNIGFEDEHRAEGLKQMAAYLTAPTSNVRYEAAMAVGNCGPAMRKNIPELLGRTMLTDPTAWKVRKAAVYALGRVGAPADEKDTVDSRAIGGLILALRDSAYQVRQEALQSIMLIGNPSTNEDLTNLRKALAVSGLDKEPSIGIWSNVALLRLKDSTIKSAADPNMVALIKFFRHSNPGVRIEAMSGLTGLKPEETALCLNELYNVIDTDADVAVKIGAIQTATFATTQWRNVVQFMEGLEKSSEDKNIKAAAKQAIDVLTGLDKKVNNPVLPKGDGTKKDAPATLKDAAMKKKDN